MSSLLIRYGLPAASAALLAAALLHGQEAGKRLDIERRTVADGNGADPVDLQKIMDNYERTRQGLQKAVAGLKTRVDEVKEGGHSAGLGGCRVRGDRTVSLDETVPARYRSRTLFFVRAPRGGARPGILPGTLPATAEVFVLEAERLRDVTSLARMLGRRVTLASAEFARAVGARCADSRITFTEDGATALVHEEAP